MSWNEPGDSLKPRMVYLGIPFPIPIASLAPIAWPGFDWTSSPSARRGWWCARGTCAGGSPSTSRPGRSRQAPGKLGVTSGLAEGLRFFSGLFRQNPEMALVDLLVLKYLPGPPTYFPGKNRKTRKNKNTPMLGCSHGIQCFEPKNMYLLPELLVLLLLKNILVATSLDFAWPIHSISRFSVFHKPQSQRGMAGHVPEH